MDLPCASLNAPAASSIGTSIDVPRHGVGGPLLAECPCVVGLGYVRGDVVIEAEEVVRIVALLCSSEPLEGCVPVGCSHTIDGFFQGSVVDVASAGQGMRLDFGSGAPRPRDVVVVGGRVLPDRQCAYVEARQPAAECRGARGHAGGGPVNWLQQHLVPAIERVAEVVLDDLVDKPIGRRVDEMTLPVMTQPERSWPIR